MNTTTRMPAAFIGHGSPMNTLELNDFTRAWRVLGEALPRPRAILCVSAHWFIQGTAVTAMPKPRVIHDFYGFPPELFAYDYPAPGSPEVAQEIADLVKPSYVGLDHDSWGLDHGTWSVLAHLFPKADIPVLQLSVHAQAPLNYHMELGAQLTPLRDRGVLVIGSGNVVHNLRRMSRGAGDHGFDWADRFDTHVRDVMTARPAGLGEVARHPDCEAAVPTPEHFLPLAYIAGIAAASGETPQVFNEGRTMGSLSMTSYLVGMTVPAALAQGHDAQSLPAQVPPEQTNT